MAERTRRERVWLATAELIGAGASDQEIRSSSRCRGGFGRLPTGRRPGPVRYQQPLGVGLGWGELKQGDQFPVATRPSPWAPDLAAGPFLASDSCVADNVLLSEDYIIGTGSVVTKYSERFSS